MASYANIIQLITQVIKKAIDYFYKVCENYTCLYSGAELNNTLIPWSRLQSQALMTWFN